MKIMATKIKCVDLVAGDLFSTADQSYWDEVNENKSGSIGEKVYIRTIQPCNKYQDPKEEVNKIYIIYE